MRLWCTIQKLSCFCNQLIRPSLNFFLTLLIDFIIIVCACLILVNWKMQMCLEILLVWFFCFAVFISTIFRFINHLICFFFLSPSDLLKLHRRYTLEPTIQSRYVLQLLSCFVYFLSRLFNLYILLRYITKLYKFYFIVGNIYSKHIYFRSRFTMRQRYQYYKTLMGAGWESNIGVWLPNRYFAGNTDERESDVPIYGNSNKTKRSARLELLHRVGHPRTERGGYRAAAHCRWSPSLSGPALSTLWPIRPSSSSWRTRWTGGGVAAERLSESGEWTRGVNGLVVHKRLGWLDWSLA